MYIWCKDKLIFLIDKQNCRKKVLFGYEMPAKAANICLFVNDLIRRFVIVGWILNRLKGRIEQ